MKQNELELVRGRFKDDEGRDIGYTRAVSIVTDPAIELSFQLFKNQSNPKELLFSIDNDKMEITGPAMICDTPILRQRNDGTFYNIYFEKQDVKDAADLFLRKANHNQANFEHIQEYTPKITLLESWFVSEKNDKIKDLGFDSSKIPTGSWMITYKVHDKELWNEIKNGDWTGFSVEIAAYEEFVTSFKKENKEEEQIKKEYKGKYQLVYTLVNDIMNSEFEDEVKYKFISRILSRV